ncbi:TPA: hypothetical protein EYP38_02805 [Candidatus Micrarchaeota archaeon]|nr:hypothetical protein [Candidatus Micrarchaeota archaeon]
MGFFDSLFGSETGKAERKADDVAAPADETKILAKPFKITTGFHPLRLGAHKRNSVNLLVRVTNLTPDPQLVSVDVALPRNHLLGFEATCLNKSVEKRIGNLRAGESTEVAIPLWANNQTKQGNYKMEVTVFAHYQNYNKVLNYMKKMASVRVV